MKSTASILFRSGAPSALTASREFEDLKQTHGTLLRLFGAVSVRQQRNVVSYPLLAAEAVGAIQKLYHAGGAAGRNGAGARAGGVGSLPPGNVR
jgi:hypothetical protein